MTLSLLSVKQGYLHTLTNVDCLNGQTDSVEEIALKISQWPKASEKYKRITVITQGSDPVVVAEDGQVKTFPVIPLPKEKLVDTNGAGIC